MSQLSHREKRNNSLFGPILIIAIGLFFLFSRLNPVTDLHWLDMLRLWPLFLIFAGLDLLATHAPRPYAPFLSGLVAIAAVIVFGYILLNGTVQTPFNYRVSNIDWQTESIHFSAEDLQSANYDIIVGPPGADVYALEDSRDLISGNITYQDNYLFHTNVSGSEANIKLAAQNNNESWVFFPDFWQDYGDSNRWQVGINGNIPAAITLETVAGRSELDLSGILLDSLILKTNAADTKLLLPDGNYDADLETNAAVTEISLPADGRQKIDLGVNAGTVTLHLPADKAVRVEVDRALGSFKSNNANLVQVNNQENIWQTANYDKAENRLDLKVNISIGSVLVD